MHNCIPIFIWARISSDIRSEITFYGEASNIISNRVYEDLPPKTLVKKLNIVILILMYFLTFTRDQSQAAAHGDANPCRYPNRRRVTFTSALEKTIIMMDEVIFMSRSEFS